MTIGIISFAALCLAACGPREVIKPPPPPKTMLLMSEEHIGENTMSMMEGMLSDYGYFVVARALHGTIFNGIKVPEEGPLDPSLAAEIAKRSQAQVLIVPRVIRSPGNLAYINGAYNLEFRWIDLPSGKVIVSRSKALYFMPRPEHVKEVMKTCLDAYRALEAAQAPRAQ